MFDTFDKDMVHPSWKDLMPRKNFDHIDTSDETIDEYVKRINVIFKNIPRAVLEQWLFLHILNFDMINNYAWIDYHKVIFSEVFWSHDEITQIQIFSEFRDYVEARSKTASLDGFMCIPEDKFYWETYGTWRTPIIVLKTSNLLNIPNQSELNKPFQLVEGHSRLGYYKAFYKYFQKGLVKMPKTHKIFLMEIG